MTNVDNATEVNSDREVAKQRALFGMLSSTWLAQGCYAVAKLGVPDLLADGPLPVADLAAKTGAHEGALGRLLRALASAGLFAETAPNTFALSGGADLLRSDSARSIRTNAIMYGEEVFRSFAEIMHTVRTGEPAFDKIHGKPFYAYLDEHPDVDRVFTTAQGARTMPEAMRHCELSGVGTIVDIGGGNGALLTEVLTEYPAMRGVLAERPESIRQGRSRMADAGLAARVGLVECDFFRSVPADADAYVLCRVLHNWSDDKAVSILRTVHAAMRDGGRLIILEELAGEDAGQPSEKDDPRPKIVDLLMLVMIEGYDRTEEQYQVLLDKAGFDVAAVRRAAGSDPRAEVAIEAVPRDPARA